jgi:hypothetical protein
VQGLVHRGFGIEGEASVDFSGDLSGNDLEDLFTELDQQAVESSVDFLVDRLALDGESASRITKKLTDRNVPAACRIRRRQQ